jgi:hypothetical protein
MSMLTDRLLDWYGGNAPSPLTPLPTLSVTKQWVVRDGDLRELVGEIRKLRDLIRKSAHDAAVTDADPMLVSNLHEALPPEVASDG